MTTGKSESEKGPAKWDLKQSFNEWLHSGAKAWARSQNAVLGLSLCAVYLKEDLFFGQCSREDLCLRNGSNGDRSPLIKGDLYLTLCSYSVFFQAGLG